MGNQAGLRTFLILNGQIHSTSREANHSGNRLRATVVGQNVSEGATAANVQGIVIEAQFDTMVYGNGPDSRLKWKAEASREWK
jgi:hypothetical protein